jgi:hypothetical protein
MSSSPSAPIRPAVLKTLQYFPVTGYIVKWVMDIASNDSMTAVSSIIQDSCMVLYLGCMLVVLMSSSVGDTPTFGIFVLILLFGLYTASIIFNALYIDIIDNTNKGDNKPKSATFWVLSQMIILYLFMSNYITSLTQLNVSTRLTQSNVSTRWLIGLLFTMMPHAWIIATNFVNMRVRPTDDAVRNIKPPQTD